ncbi:8441_t:CDS:2 [Entrophospora sp. SA101]|nr:8441_t:CDS:2 [Entrophospora sp. SA101]
MNVAIALTAICHGAVIANHVEVLNLLKDEFNVINGARVRDNLTGEEWDVKAKGVINATGAFTDSIRSMDDPSNNNIVAPSSGTHVILPNYYSPRKMGLLDPETSDGRVIFFLPWEGNTIAGTTDSSTEVTFDPKPKEEEIQWILHEVGRYLNPDIKVRRDDVLAAWSGIRPLVRDPSAKNTAELVRNHMINVSSSKLITISGGKWTTYRAMAQDTVEKAIEVFDLKPTNECITEKAKLIGSHGYSRTMFIKLIQHFDVKIVCEGDEGIEEIIENKNLEDQNLLSINSIKKSSYYSNSNSSKNSVNSINNNTNVNSLKAAATSPNNTFNNSSIHLISHIDKLFSDRIEIFGIVEMNRNGVMMGLIKILLKEWVEMIRLQLLTNRSFQQIQLDSEFVRIKFWKFIDDERLINTMLQELTSNAFRRCVEDPLPLENSVR